MNSYESGPAMPWTMRESQMAIDAIGLIQGLLTDEEPGLDRPDIWSVTWDELQTVEDDIYASDYQKRQLAKSQLHFYYTMALESLYPELKNIKTIEDMMLATAMIPDLPPCDGEFTVSQYETVDGTQVEMLYAMVRLGEAMTICVSIIDDNNNAPRMYVLGYDVDGSVWGNGGDLTGFNANQEYEDEILEKVDSSQRSSLQRVLAGALHEHELDMVLAEIRIVSEADIEPVELDRMIEYARAEYYNMRNKNATEIQSGEHDISPKDLYRMHQIIFERTRQLGLDS